MLRRLPAKAADVLPINENFRATGIETLLAIAAELNERQILTARGGKGSFACWRAPISDRPRIGLPRLNYTAPPFGSSSHP